MSNVLGGRLLDQHFMDHIAAVGSDMFLVLFGEFRKNNRFSVSQMYLRPVQPRKMIFKNVRSSGDRHRNDRTSRFLCNFKGAILKWKKAGGIFRIPVSCSFRENADGDAGFDLVNGGQNGF